MPGVYTYPGVYVEEVPSGVRTIAGVATSITAFIGRTLMGPLDEPVRLQNYGDFERIFGGLWTESPLTYSVQQYFANGGADTLIVRLAKADAEVASISMPAAPPGKTATATVPANNAQPVTLAAADPSLQGATLAVPAEAVSAETMISVGPAWSFPATGYVVLGPPVLMKSSGPFTKDVTVTVPYDKSKLPAGKTKTDVVLLAWDGTQATAKPQSAATDSTASAAVPALATYAAAVAETSAPRKKDKGEETTAPAARAGTTEAADTATLLARSPGTWGNNLQAIVDYGTRDPDDSNLFNLTVRLVDPATQVTLAEESFLNLSILPGSPRYAASVLAQESQYVTAGTLPGRPVANTPKTPYVADGAGTNGGPLEAADYKGDPAKKTGIYALEKADIFNLLSIPPRARYDNPEGVAADVPKEVWDEAVQYSARRRAVVLVDPPWSWKTVDDAAKGMSSPPVALDKNAAIYWPFLRVNDPLKDYRPYPFAPGGAVAGLIGRTDRLRGLWKAPAGQDATLLGISELTVKMTDGENGILNPLGLNCLRTLPLVGPVVWGARTSVGADRLASEWKYLPVRRVALYIEESLYAGMQWVVFEPNDERLWSQIRLNAGAFMQTLFLDGAFQGATPAQAYFVRCDASNNPQINIDRGIVTVEVGFAPLKPAEFVVIRLQQIAGQTPV